jgi:hypothetical protein
MKTAGTDGAVIREELTDAAGASDRNRPALKLVHSETIKEPVAVCALQIFLTASARGMR